MESLNRGIAATVAAIATSFYVAAAAEEPPPAPACSGGAFHAFDFWIGDWAVSNAQTGAASGENLIAFAHDGCVIREQWSGADGVKGESVTYYDPIDEKWRQRWVSSGYGGYALELEGVAEEAGRMTLSGAAHFYARKQAVDMRITWKADGDARLIQTFETRSPETGEWKTWFEGRYVRK
ncbi:MAG: hypothetical protein ACOZAA_17570 [Pseudomonadota bacterium]